MNSMENKTTPFLDNAVKNPTFLAPCLPHNRHSHSTFFIFFFYLFFPYLIQLSSSKDNKPQSRMEAFSLLLLDIKPQHSRGACLQDFDHYGLGTWRSDRASYVFGSLGLLLLLAGAGCPRNNRAGPTSWIMKLAYPTLTVIKGLRLLAERQRTL